MTLPDEYERAAFGGYPEDEEESNGENNQDDGDGVSSIEPTKSKQDSDTDLNEHVTKDRDGPCYGNPCKTCLLCILKSCTNLVRTAQPIRSFTAYISRYIYGTSCFLGWMWKEPLPLEDNKE